MSSFGNSFKSFFRSRSGLLFPISGRNPQRSSWKNFRRNSRANSRSPVMHIKSSWRNSWRSFLKIFRCNTKSRWWNNLLMETFKEFPIKFLERFPVKVYKQFSINKLKRFSNEFLQVFSKELLGEFQKKLLEVLDHFLRLFWRNLGFFFGKNT